MPTKERDDKPAKQEQAQDPLDKAIARVYQLYGPSLSVFFGHVKDSNKAIQKQVLERDDYTTRKFW
jgi:hypothetical protein